MLSGVEWLEWITNGYANEAVFFTIKFKKKWDMVKMVTALFGNKEITRVQAVPESLI